MVRIWKRWDEEKCISLGCCLYLTDSVGMVVLIDGQVKKTQLALDVFRFCLWQRWLHQSTTRTMREVSLGKL